jgi:hypothetical protein
VEASGGVSLETVTAVARTGVDLISVGKLTHSALAADILWSSTSRRLPLNLLLLNSIRRPSRISFGMLTHHATRSLHVASIDPVWVPQGDHWVQAIKENVVGGLYFVKNVWKVLPRNGFGARAR